MLKQQKVTMLTDAQELQINSVEKYTHDYEAEAFANEEVDDDIEIEFTERFELSIKDQFDRDEDLSGLTVYFKADKLVAFYDYENFKGAVFA